MSVVWGKVWRDLAHNKARTTLAVLSTAVGIFALGLVFGLSGVMHMRMTEAQRAAIPAHISFWGGPFSPDIVDAVRREPGVLDAEGAIVTSFRWKFVGEETWRDGEVIARADYGAQRMNLIRLLDGYWPTKRVLGVERLSSKQLGVLPGTTILIEFGGRERGLLVDGVLQAHAVLAPEWGGEVTFFATPEAVAWLTGREYGEDFNWLHVRLEAYSQEVAEETAERVKDRLERIGLSVKGYEVTAPDVHLLQDTVDGVLIILAIMGGLSLGLSAFLIFNTMNAIIAQQVWQIGMMKAVGATVVWVVGVYLATALIYGGLALLLAVPLGAVSAHLLAVWLLDLFNVGTSTFQIEPVAIGIQMTVGVVVPVLAALMPVWVGARVTVREAIGAYGIGSGFGRGWLDRLIGRIRSLPPSMALSLRNTFRRKARVALTLVTLTLSLISTL
jgi:putative ABC transport system permease protein